MVEGLGGSELVILTAHLNYEIRDSPPARRVVINCARFLNRLRQIFKPKTMPVTTLSRLNPYNRFPFVIPGRIGAIYNAATLAARMAYKYRKPIQKGYRSMFKIARARRVARSRAARRTTIGRGIRSNVCQKERMITTEPQPLDTRTIYFTDLTDISKTTTAAINGRQRHQLTIRGIQSKWSVRNDTNKPIKMTFAILVPKNSNTISNDGFFRDYNQSRDVNFSTLVNNQQMMNLPISTDKYTVLWRINRTVYPNNSTSAGYNSSVGKSWVDFYRYTPIKRQVRYNDDTGTECENKFFFVWWTDEAFTAGGGAIVPNALVMQADHVAFYKDK